MAPGTVTAAPPAKASEAGGRLAEHRARLALKRSFLAAERTLMAWVRTSLSMISFGFTMVKVLDALEATGTRRGVYWLHLAGFAAYSSLIGYLLVERAERGAWALPVYACAMVLHFLILDRTLREEHSRFYDLVGRLILAASVLIGWLIGTRTPLSDVVFARLFAVLAGGVVITSVTAELSGELRGRFWPFCPGALGYALLLVLT